MHCSAREVDLHCVCSAHQQTRSLLSPSPLCHPIKPPPTTSANIPQNALATVLSARNKIIFLTNCVFIITPSHSNVSPLQNTFSPISPPQPPKPPPPESLPLYSCLHSYLSPSERPQRHIRLEAIRRKQTSFPSLAVKTGDSTSDSIRNKLAPN